MPTSSSLVSDQRPSVDVAGVMADSAGRRLVARPLRPPSLTPPKPMLLNADATSWDPDDAHHPHQAGLHARHSRNACKRFLCAERFHILFLSSTAHTGIG
jgi:hypothetical protein